MSIAANNTFVYSPLDLWIQNSIAAGTTLASASQAAQTTVGGTATVTLRNVAKRCGITLSAPIAGQVAPTCAILKDGSSNSTLLAGKKSWQISILLLTSGVGLGCVNIDEDNLHIVGTAGNAMTLEFNATSGGVTTPVAAGLNSVTLQGYFFPKNTFPVALVA